MSKQRKDEPLMSEAQLKLKLPALFSQGHALEKFLDSNIALNERYQYDTSTGCFRSKKKFKSYVEHSPEKDFYALLHPNDPQRDLAQHLSESDLIKYYLIYRQIGEFVQKKKLKVDWQALFVEEMTSQVYAATKQSLDEAMTTNQPNWSSAKNKFYHGLIETISKNPSLEQKTHYYQQMLAQAQQIHFHYDSPQHVFHQFSSLVEQYEYERLSNELHDMLQPMLYYPQTEEQQINLCATERHCLFLDKDTKQLKYINTHGTIFTVPSTSLQSKNTHQIKAQGEQWVLEYQDKPHSKTVSQLLVTRAYHRDFGSAFHLSLESMRQLVPKDFPEDPIIKLAEKTLKAIKYTSGNLHHVTSFFSLDNPMTIHHRMAGLIEIQAMLRGHPTREIRQVTKKPEMTDFMGRGRNTYVFYDNPLKPHQSELWYVNRSGDMPVLTQFPMGEAQAKNLRYLFSGAQQGKLPAVHGEDKATQKLWYELGRDALVKKLDDPQQSVLQLSVDAAKNIPNLILSSTKIYRHFTEDWTYNETSNALTDLLENTEVTLENTHLLERCRSIHQHLELIERDRWGAFPESRGVVPPEKRKKIMQMMMALVKDKDAPDARHYFRTQHRVYHTPFSDDQLTHYEPGSFVWDKKDLYYLDEHKNKTIVPMTDSIQRKLLALENASGSAEFTISANDVYELMTRPRMFYYYRSIPITFDLRWLDFSYYIPLRFDRSQGLHTGTAQEMTREIQEHKLSVSAMLYKIGEFILFMIVPLVLTACGFDWMDLLPLDELATMIVSWVMIVWNVQFTYSYIRYALLMQEITHPELNQLDAMLENLNSDVEKLLGFSPEKSRIISKIQPNDSSQFDDDVRSFHH